MSKKEKKPAETVNYIMLKDEESADQIEREILGGRCQSAEIIESENGFMVIMTFEPGVVFKVNEDQEIVINDN